MAAEHVFYGENGNGVGGDLQSATGSVAWMVGTSGMGPEPIELNGFSGDVEREKARLRIKKRLQEIGSQLMNRASGDFQHDAVAAVLADRFKRDIGAEILGLAYVAAYNTIRINKEAVERIAETLIERHDLYGNELVALLDSQNLKRPELDLTAEESWPAL
jgi:ATP-dependent Zn protease